MSEWIEYTGSDEQIADIKSAESYAVMGIDVGEQCSKFVSGPFVWIDDHPDLRMKAQSSLKELLEASNVTHYLICQPHPYAAMIKIWADTGCPVWIMFPEQYKETEFIGFELVGYFRTGTVFKTTLPNWNIPGAKYSLTPFEDQS